jgi:hypothetical protein
MGAFDGGLMFRRLSFVFSAALSACTVYTSDDGSRPPAAPVEYAPTIEDAQAGCYWDDYYYDDVWYFEASALDANGPYDVVDVWADVYDELHGPTYLESFQLYPTNDPAVWFSDWLGASTYLDCWYDGYTVDFVAYDSLGTPAVLTVWAYTY